MFIHLKTRRTARLGADQVVSELRRKLAAFPGINVFMQIRPHPHRRTDTKLHLPISPCRTWISIELQDVSTSLTAAMANDPTFVGQSTTDLDLTTPAVNVDIDRDRAAALGVTRHADRKCAGRGLGGQQVSQIYGSVGPVSGDPGTAAAISAGRSALLSRLYVTAAGGALVPLTAVTHIGPGTMPLSINHPGQLPAVTISFNLAPGKALSDAVTAIDAADAADRRAGQRAGKLPGHGAGLPELDAEHGSAAADRDDHGLYHPGHSL